MYLLLIAIANRYYQTVFAYFVYFLMKTKKHPFDVSYSTTLYRNSTNKRIYMTLYPMYGVLRTSLTLSSSMNTTNQIRTSYP